jgi:hypothetical protein
VIHWSLPDPSAAEGSIEERQCIFDEIATRLDVRIRLLLTQIEQERKKVSILFKGTSTGEIA